MFINAPDIRAKLIANFEINKNRVEEIDFEPVVLLYSANHLMKWLLTELDVSDDDSAFGLCDLGFGITELGYVPLSELESRGVKVAERWIAAGTLSEYTGLASKAGRIVLEPHRLKRYREQSVKRAAKMALTAAA